MTGIRCGRPRISVPRSVAWWMVTKALADVEVLLLLYSARILMTLQATQDILTKYLRFHTDLNFTSSHSHYRFQL